MPEVLGGVAAGESGSMKKTRQACVNCRRKKSKCPGEKPQCSTCKRLNQSCTYEPFESPSRKRRRSDGHGTEDGLPNDEVSRRFGTIEQKLEELAASMQKTTPSTRSATPTQATVYHESTAPSSLESVSYSNEGDTSQASKRWPSSTMAQSTSSGTLPQDVIQDGVNTYFRHFHAQPYALLSQTTTKTPASIHSVVLNPMLALSIRCSSHSFWTDQSKLGSWIRTLTERTWNELVQLYAEGDSSLPYLQGLCLLAQGDFADGRVKRAHSQIALGLRIAQCSGYLTFAISDNVNAEDIVRCTWTLFMLDRTFSITRLVTPTLSYQHFQLRKPTPEAGLSREVAAQKTSPNELSVHEQDIGALIIGVYSMWDDVLKYVFQKSTDNTVPPWQPGSELATIEYRFADFEPEFSTHRYREVNFPRQAIEEPHLRPYFASWLYFQLTYMSIQCLVHHPFIMFIKLQHVIRKVPPSFLQKSYKSSLIHSRWIIRFLDEMDEAGMMLYDPFIGFLAAIAATIQLEHTLSKHSDIAAAARLSFRNAIKFMRKLAKYWNNIQELLGVVEELAARLQHRRTLYYSQDDYDGILPVVESERVGLSEDDATLMWKVFDYASMSASKGTGVSNTNGKRTNHDGDQHPTTHFYRPDPILNGTASHNPQTSMSYGNSLNTGFSNVQVPTIEETLEMPNSALFDQLPEDWAFTIDDWTLFGAPGSTYFYNESS